MSYRGANTVATVGLLLAWILSPSVSSAQYPWPVAPFHSSHWITGTFCEYRDTAPAPHFHNGVDIPKADGSPVYAVADGYVTGLSRTGSNAYVRVGNFAYVHIQPAPNLSVGSQVTAFQTVLGTILSGQGHVHFIDGTYNHEINPLRPGGGLTPYEDPWPPRIDYVRFYPDGAEEPFGSNTVEGPIDLVVKVSEWNGPPSSPISCRNNGCYELGFAILTPDSTTTLLRSGVRFRFSSKPSNDYVHNVFFAPLSSTTSHVYLATNFITRNSFIDTEDLGVGEFLALVWARDTRGNADTVLVPFSVVPPDRDPPEAPKLLFAKGDSAGFTVQWQAPPDTDVVGYRLWYSFGDGDWKLKFDESTLKADCTCVRFNAVLHRPLYFRLTAIDGAPRPNESRFTPVYGMRQGPNPVLLVDAGATAGKEWQQAAAKAMVDLADRLPENLAQQGFDICHISALDSGQLNLSDYTAAVFLFGAPSQNSRSPLSPGLEESLCSWMASGGRAVLSGATFVSDLDTAFSKQALGSDTEFLESCLAIRCSGRRNGSGTVRITGPFLSAVQQSRYGQALYRPDSVDVLAPLGRAVPILLYGDSTVAAAVLPSLAHSSAPQVAVLGFPLETLENSELIGDLLNFALGSGPTGTAEMARSNLPNHFRVHKPHPNPFNSWTVIPVELPSRGRLLVAVYDVLGREVRRLYEGFAGPGRTRVRWDSLDNSLDPVPSGVYICRVLFGRRAEFVRLLVLR